MGRESLRVCAETSCPISCDNAGYHVRFFLTPFRPFLYSLSVLFYLFIGHCASWQPRHRGPDRNPAAPARTREDKETRTSTTTALGGSCRRTGNFVWIYPLPLLQRARCSWFATGIRSAGLRKPGRRGPNPQEFGGTEL
jgi:hypothetical protein